jgi:tight adherence protein B
MRLVIRRLASKQAEPSRQTDLATAIDEVAGLARAGVDRARLWEPVTGPLPPGADIAAALAQPAGSERPVSPGERQIRRALVAVERLAQEAGASRADLLEALSGALSDQAEVADAQHVAVAGPRATTRVLAWLPVLGLVLGTFIGAQPLSAIVHGGVAGVSAVIGVGLMVAGWAWSRSLLRAAQTDDDGAIVTISLLAGAVETGLSLPAALQAVGRAGDGPVEQRLALVGQRLERGQLWADAWAESPPGSRAASRELRVGRGRAGRGLRAGGGHAGKGLQAGQAGLGTGGGLQPAQAALLTACHRALTLAWNGGVAAAPLLRALAGRWRRQAKRQAGAAGARLGVRLMLPLGLCYLPAFVAVGLVPVVVSLASSIGVVLG